MRYRRHVVAVLFAAAVTVAAVPVRAQNPAQNQPATPNQTSPPVTDRGGNTPVPPAGGRAGAGQGTPGTTVGAPAGGQRAQRPSAYPTRAVDPAKVERGKALFGVNCAFCHGSDARGGEGGPNLIRSGLVLEDQDGEHIAPTIQNGRPDRGMPKFDLSTEQISEIAAYLHSFRVGGYDVSRMKPPSILVGNAEAGRGDFERMCGTCHSATGDMAGIASRITEPRTLQQTWIMPSGGGRGFAAQQPPLAHVPPVTVSVKWPDGKSAEGRLDRIDDFTVTLTTADGEQQTFRREGDVPQVTIHDPLDPHRELLPKYTDKQIHDITAYLETLK